MRAGEPLGGVRVDVDEPGRDGCAGGVDGACGVRHRRNSANGDDPAVEDGDVSLDRSAPVPSRIVPPRMMTSKVSWRCREASADVVAWRRGRR